VLKAPTTNSAQIHPSFTVASNGQHFCGVHKFTFKNHPDALKEGRIFECKTDVIVCSRLYGMALAYSLNEAHVGDHSLRKSGGPTGYEDDVTV
jgi:hypothetical protein